MTTNKILIGIIVILLAVICLVSIDKKPVQKVNYQKTIDSLIFANRNIEEQIKINKIAIDVFEKKIDSLAKIKEKINIKYIQKSNEIKNYSSHNLILEFDSIFSNTSIK